MIFSTAENSVQIKEFSVTKSLQKCFWHFIHPFCKEMGQIKVMFLKESQVFRDCLHILLFVHSVIYV